MQSAAGGVSKLATRLHVDRALIYRAKKGDISDQLIRACADCITQSEWRAQASAEDIAEAMPVGVAQKEAPIDFTADDAAYKMCQSHLREIAHLLAEARAARNEIAIVKYLDMQRKALKEFAVLNQEMGNNDEKRFLRSQTWQRMMVRLKSFMSTLDCETSKRLRTVFEEDV
jgi:hypothetical protein